MDLIRETLGNNRIDRLLGEGGMGQVYHAYDIKLQREVAVKVVHPHLARQLRNRLMQEAQTMARLDHPGIVRVYNMDEDKNKGLLYLQMEFIKGGNLRQLLDELLRQHKWLPLTEAVLLVEQLCQTVEYAHQHGVLHRDIKPGNLMLKLEPTDGLPFRIVLTDLGLAKLTEGLAMTQEGTFLGTPAYMSPEQASGQPTDQRSDVYSLGILLYELAVGRLPFSIRSLTEATRYHTQVPPPAPRSLRPDLPEEFEQIILKALAKDPSQRYSSARELGEALGAVTIQSAAETTSISTEIVEPSAGGETSLITEYEKSVITNARPADASLATVFDAGSIGQRGLSVFGDQSVPPSDQPLIQIVNKDKSVRVQALPTSTGTGTIGRDRDNLIALDDEKASRKHVEISWNGLECRVIDLGSSNGTYLEKDRILPGIAETWRANQILRIGDTFLRFIGPVGQVHSLRTDSTLTGAGNGLVAVAVDPQHLQVQAGGTATARITVLNQSPEVDHFSLSLEGIPVEWINSLPPHVELMPGEQKDTVFTLQVPRTPESQAGQHEMNLKVTSENEPDQSVAAMVILTVDPYSQFEGNLQPQRLRAGQTGSLTIFNRGNSLEKFTVQFQDAAHELNFQPAQAQVEVPAGKSVEKKFQAQVRETRWIGGSKSHPYSASISLQAGERQTLGGEMLSRALIPPWLPPLILFLCISLLGAVSFAAAQAAQSRYANATATAIVSDLDHDGLTFQDEITLGCNPDNADTDGDGLSDADEKVFGTDCNVRDSDHDNLTDGEEVNDTKTNPMNPDTDGDTLRDNIDPNPLRLPTITPTLRPTSTARPTATAVPTTAVPPTRPPRPTATTIPTITPTNPPAPPDPPQPTNPPGPVIHTDTVAPFTSGQLCPNKIGGDREFNSNGPAVSASAELFTKNGAELWVRIHLHEKETRSDWSEAEGWWEFPLWTMPGGATFLDYTPNQPSTADYIDTNNQLDIPTVQGSALVQRFEIMGDTGGDDIGNCTNDDAYINVFLNQIQVRYSTPN